MNNNWIDILPPAPPAEPLPVWLWLSIIVLLLLLALLYLWYQSAQQKSLRTLKRLQQQLANTNNIQHIPFAISETIKQRFNVNNIELIVIPGSPGWQEYKQRLVSSCFNKQKPEYTDMCNLISEAAQWLRQGKS